MKSVFFVQAGEAELARRMETIIMSLPDASGILFIGVSVLRGFPHIPGEKREVKYQVIVGCDRSRDVEVTERVVRIYLEKEINEGSESLEIKCYRGIDRQSDRPLLI